METGTTQSAKGPLPESATLAGLAATLMAKAAASNHRLALVLAGNESWTLSAASAALSAVPQRAVWLAERESCDGCLPISCGHKLLGSEVDVLVYDAHGGLDPDSFGAALGALRGGGLILLLTPPLEHWPRLPDPQAARIAVHPYSPDQVKGRFLARFIGTLSQSHDLVVVQESGPIPQPHLPSSCTANPIAKPNNDCRTPEQERAVAAILETARRRARRPLVITSDRGRGKSSALGIAAATLIAREGQSTLVTAPRRSAVDPIFHHAARRLPGSEVHRNCISYAGARLQFLPPDALCRTVQRAHLLVVDEAAGIPAPLLEQLLREHPRIVFATTAQGYEGTGRGFQVRFRRTLDRLTPGWRELTLQMPIRWAPEDPLERFAAHALLLNAAPAADRQLVGALPDTCRFMRLNRDTLAKEEATLSQLFGLLVLAHYQTRPMDLRHLLDGPNVRVYALLHGRQVAATALVAIEGGFEADLGREIFAGRRRPRGHVLPQTLSAHAGIEEATALAYARVIRIAVHPAAQRRGLGRHLLEGIVDDARAQGLDLAGSSFAATKDLLDFWGRCNFLPVHLGTSRNAASGAHAAVVVRPVSGAGQSMEKLASKRLGERLPQMLTEPLQDLEPTIASCLLRSTSDTNWLPSERELREIESFTSAFRSYEAALPLLVKLVCARIGNSLRLNKLDESEHDLLICKLLQHRGWAETARQLGLTGRAQVLSLLRVAVGKLVGDCERSRKDMESGDDTFGPRYSE